MKLWGGRFSKATDALVDDFNSSIRFDARMYRQDIKGSMAHAEMLGRQGIIPKDDAALIVKTLGEILKDIENGKVEFSIDAEDIHMNIETILTERIGDAGKKLHTGRPGGPGFAHVSAGRKRQIVRNAEKHHDRFA